MLILNLCNKTKSHLTKLCMHKSSRIFFMNIDKTLNRDGFAKQSISCLILTLHINWSHTHLRNEKGSYILQQLYFVNFEAPSKITARPLEWTRPIQRAISAAAHKTRKLSSLILTCAPDSAAIFSYLHSAHRRRSVLSLCTQTKHTRHAHLEQICTYSIAGLLRK